MNAAHINLNLYQVCRLCLCELNGSSFVPIFDNKDSNLPHKIKSCFAISVDETDRLPNVLCPACTRDVERFYKFKEKVIKNNAFLKSYVYQQNRKAVQFINRSKDDARSISPPVSSTTKSKRTSSVSSVPTTNKSKRVIKHKTDLYQDTSENLTPLNNYDNCELSNTFFDNSNKVKVEIIPQVDNEMYSASGTVYSEIKNNIVEMWPASPSDESRSFRAIKSTDEAGTPLESSSKSPDYTSVIRHSSDDYGNGSSYDKYISVHVKEEVCKDNVADDEEYDSEDTKSASSLTFREEEEDKLIIDEETMEVKHYVNVHPSESIVHEGVRTSDSCILLRTLISNSNQLSSGSPTIKVKTKPSTFSPQILVNEMTSYSSPSNTGANTSSLEKSSTRRKQKCPTKSASDNLETGEETDEDSAELAPLSEQTPQPVLYQQEIINISPVTVTCTSNGKEEIVGYNQLQFLDEVLSRHSSPATTPPMVVPSQAERLHKACDVLLRAASKIQDLPPGIQQEEVVVEEETESITLYPTSSQMNDSQTEQITIRHNPVPLYEINFSSVNTLNEVNRVTKKIKSRDKVQNMPQHKECNNCHAIQTTIWRRDRFGNIVCNACGLYYKLHNYDRPCRMRRDEIHKRNRKRNVNENKVKKPKRNSSGSYELNELSRVGGDQENSMESCTPPKNYNDNTTANHHVTISDIAYHPFGTIKKRRRSSVLAVDSNVSGDDGCNEEIVKEEQESSDVLEQTVVENAVEEIDVSDNIKFEGDISISLNNEEEEEEEEEKGNMSAFQLSTHFMPINGKVYEDSSNENSMNETPLNLAAGSH